MRFQKSPNKILGKWYYQAQFDHRENPKKAAEWLAGRSTGDFEISGDSFYTNQLQDIFALRIQFDQQIKLIRQFDKL